MNNTYKELNDLAHFLKSRITFINCNIIKIDYQSHYITYDNTNNKLIINLQPNINLIYDIVTQIITIEENSLILEVIENCASLIQLRKNEQTMIGAKLGIDYTLNYCNNHLISYNKQQQYYNVLQHILLYKDKLEIYSRPFAIGQHKIEDLKTIIMFNNQEYFFNITTKNQCFNLHYNNTLVKEYINIYQILPARKLEIIHDIVQKLIQVKLNKDNTEKIFILLEDDNVKDVNKFNNTVCNIIDNFEQHFQ